MHLKTLFLSSRNLVVFMPTTLRITHSPDYWNDESHLWHAKKMHKIGKQTLGIVRILTLLFQLSGWRNRKWVREKVKGRREQWEKKWMGTQTENLKIALT